VDRLVFCPLPGVGLPGVDLIQSPIRAGVTSGGHIRFTGLVPRINLISGGDSPYKPGELEAMLSQGRLKVVSLTVGSAAAPEQAWRMTAFRLVQGHWVGTRMRMAAFESATPTYRADYHLAEARDASLDAPAFDVNTYLAKGASVSDSSDGNTVFFTYDPQAGSLAEQARRARAKGKAAGAEK
jgi:hypothetical protein